MFSAWLFADSMRRKAFRMVQKHPLIARKEAFTAKPDERSDEILEFAATRKLS
jgi:hypothetical protein